MPDSARNRRFRTPFQSNRFITGLLIAAVVSTVVGVVSLLLRHGFLRVYPDLTTHQSEQFTELFFNEHETLPKIIVPGVASTFSFEIVNRETQTKTYTYAVVVTQNGVASEIRRADVTLLNGQSSRQLISMTIPSPGEAVVVEVRLIGMPENIMFRSQS